MEVESRCKVSTLTHVRLFKSGKALPVTESINQRPSHGTTVTVHDLYHSLPVRKKGLNQALELERIRQRIEAIALVHPNVSFSLRNDSSGSKVMQTHKSNSVLGAFTYLFGTSKSRYMKQVHSQQEQFKVQGYMSTEGQSTKSLQFVYVNDRLVLKTKLHKAQIR